RVLFRSRRTRGGGRGTATHQNHTGPLAGPDRTPPGIASLRGARAYRPPGCGRSQYVHGVGSRADAAATMTFWSFHPLARRRPRHFLLFGLLLLALSLCLNAARAEEEFLDPEDAFRYSVAVSAPATLDIHYAIAPEYYMYRERFELSAPEGLIVAAEYPPGLVKYDPRLKRTRRSSSGKSPSASDSPEGPPAK